MADFQIFRFKDAFPVRIADRDGAPWFVAADVCKALAISNSRTALANLDEDEISGVEISYTGKSGRQLTNRLNIISESGLYALIIRSSKPAAREFRKWITSEVLPTIRRTGTYTLTARLPLSIKASREQSEQPPRHPEADVSADPEDDPAKRSTAELVERTNRRLTAGENIPPHVLRYVAEVARIASGVWYRDCFGVDGRAAKTLPDLSGILLPELTVEENRAARRIMDIVRKRGKCNMACIAVNSKARQDARHKIVAALVAAGLLHCSGLPDERGSRFWI